MNGFTFYERRTKTARAKTTVAVVARNLYGIHIYITRPLFEQQRLRCNTYFVNAVRATVTWYARPVIAVFTSSSSSFFSFYPILSLTLLSRFLRRRSRSCFPPIRPGTGGGTLVQVYCCGYVGHNRILRCADRLGGRGVVGGREERRTPVVVVIVPPPLSPPPPTTTFPNAYKIRAHVSTASATVGGSRFSARIRFRFFARCPRRARLPLRLVPDDRRTHISTRLLGRPPSS